MNYRFTIVMTVYQRVELLLRALYSVLTQYEKSWELIIVADGPHPDAEELVHDFLFYRPEYADQISYVTVVRPAASWGNQARRQGLLQARGDYTCFLGHDCLLSASYLATHERNLRRIGKPALSVVGIEYWRIEEGKLSYRERMPLPVWSPEEWEIGDLDLTCLAFPTAHAIRLGVFAGEIAAYYEADVDGFLTCRAELPVVYDPAIVAAHF